MKRNFLLLIPLVLGLASCGGPSIPNQEVVDKVKEILNKQDLSEFHSKTIRGMYTQEYDVLDIDNDEGERASNYFNYSGSGLFGMYYDLNADEYNSIVDEKGNVDIFDAISKGKGYYGLIQSARTMSFDREGGLEAEIYNLDIVQSLTLKTTEQDVWVDNTLYVSDDGVFQYESRQELSASINKELLFGSVSTRSFREIFSRVSLFDTPGNVEHLDKLFFTTCRELVSKSDKVISDFVLTNQVSIQEKEDNIEVTFVFANEEIEEEETNYIFPGAIKGTLFFDKSTYQFLDFAYEMAYKIETSNEDTGSVKLINIKFTYEGETYRGLPKDSWEPTNPTIYDDVSEFLKDVNEQVIPPNIHL